MTQTLSTSLTSLIQKYNLDISIVNNKGLGVFNRVDAEFYQVNYYKTQKFLQEKGAQSLGDIAFVTDGEHGSPCLDPEGYICLSGTNIRTGNIIIDENTKRITEAQYEKNQRVLLKKGNILLSIVGTVGNSALIREDINGVTDRNVATIKSLSSEYDPIFVSLFLNSKYGRLQTERFCTGNVQPLLNLTQVRSIKIPLPSSTFQYFIASLVQEAHTQRELSKSLYAESEQILLRELGLIDWTPTEVGIAEKMSEEVRLFGRCDAEFFQPKYDELFGRLSKFQTQKLGDIVDYQKGVEPGADAYSETGIPFIRVADVSIQGIDIIEKNISSELFEEYGEKYSPKKDEILFTKDGTIGISFVMCEDMKTVLSGAFLRLQKKINIESEYLALVLNSIVSKMQIERFSGGAIIAHLKPSDAMEMIIPILSESIQSLISEKIVASHSARETSKKLLEKAKRAVEIFIEEDEGRANSYLLI